MLVEKEIIRPGVYWYVDQDTGLPRKLQVSPEEVRRLHADGTRMLEAGLSVPVPLEHQARARAMTPAERAAEQLLHNAGWVKGYAIKKVKEEDGTEVDALFGSLDIEDEEVKGKLPRTIRWTSPWINSFTDGDGRKWDGVISHLALTTRPRITRQTPFPTVSAAMSYAASLATQATDLARPPTAPGRGLALSRAALLLEQPDHSYRPAYPVAFSLYTGAALAVEEIAEKSKKDRKKDQGGPPPKEGDGRDRPKDASTDAGTNPLVTSDPDRLTDDQAGPLERQLVDGDGDISVYDVLCDLLAAVGIDLPEGTTKDNFAQRLYQAAMDQVKGKSTDPLGGDPMTKPKDPTPPATTPPATGGAAPPPVVQESPPLYMSLEQASAIQDPGLRQIALSLVAQQQETQALRQNAFEQAKRRRTDRIERICSRVPDPAFKEKITALASGAKLSLGADGVVKDTISDSLDLIESGLRTSHDLPRLLTTPSALLSETPHPEELSGEMTDARRKEVVSEICDNTGLPEPPQPPARQAS